jgi:hypothetical protein
VNENLVTGLTLDHIAANALQAASSIVVPKTNPDISTPTGQRSVHDKPPATGLNTAHYTSGNRGGSLLVSSLSGLPPLCNGVREPDGRNKETLSSRCLPSLGSTLGELRDLGTEHSAEQDLGRVPSRPSTAFPTSPAGNIGHRFSVSTLPSSARSPPQDYRTPSLHCAPSASAHGYTTSSTYPYTRTEYSSNNAGDTAGDTPTTDRSASKPATSTSINSASSIDRMSVDSNIHPQPISGSYTCTVHGCNAPSFQTQYLLNSHMNVHSSARPHYCLVKGCPRSEGGKGFKRKNEMIRHGLVHDSPGYVCPFCPNREHKYPRPNNLQRYVTSQA